MKLFLNTISTMVEKPLRLSGHMKAIVVPIMSKIVTDCGHNNGKLFQVGQLKLNGKTIWSCFHEHVSHLGDIQTVHVVVIAHVVGFVDIKSIFQEGSQYAIINSWQVLKIVSNKASR